MRQLLYLLAALPLLLGSCGNDNDWADPGTDEKGAPLAITVAVATPVDNTVAGMQASTPQSYGAAPFQTRATDNGYATSFDTGDAIGIWVYEGATERYANKQWVRRADGTWEPATTADNVYYNGTAMTVKACFPYDAAATALPEAATFAVQADQSTAAAYRASDLLRNADVTWTGSTSPLALLFTHAMAMVEVVPSSVLNLQSITLQASTVPGGAETVITFWPVIGAGGAPDGTYRALLPGQAVNANLVFTCGNDVFVYPVNKTLEAGKYYRYEVVIQ